MGKIKVTECGGIKGLKVVEPTVFGDARGYFMETYNYNDFKEAGIDVEFVQDNQSSSHKGVLRGLHFQINYPQDKLVLPCLPGSAILLQYPDHSRSGRLHRLDDRNQNICKQIPHARKVPGIRVQILSG